MHEYRAFGFIDWKGRGAVVDLIYLLRRKTVYFYIKICDGECFEACLAPPLAWPRA
jgi:hypothetical protein